VIDLGCLVMVVEFPYAVIWQPLLRK